MNSAARIDALAAKAALFSALSGNAARAGQFARAVSYSTFALECSNKACKLQAGAVKRANARLAAARKAAA